MKISYAITVCNEFIEIQRLLKFLLENKHDKDEIVILYDSKNGSKEVEQVLDHYNSIIKYYTLHKSPFNNHFGDWKNLLTSLCSGDYIYQIDADEIVSSYVLEYLPEVLSHNDVDVLKVPRINTVEGLTQEHIQVHEILEGYFSVSYLPTDEEWCLKHPKTIERQEKQNSYYDTL